MAADGAGNAVAANGKEVDDDLLAGFPNLRSLPPIAPPEEWANTAVPRLPPECTSGVLENGLSYFVQENKEPKQRASLYLVVGFGSLVEEEDERGIAHIIEHLGFSATKAYESHAIVKFLESIGAPFGACQNAYTSFDRTVYTLHVPTDKEGILAETLTVLREFAYFTRISDEDLDKERKVVLEEWRESKNAQGRLFEDYINALCKGCKWCERLPIGTENVIKNVSAETLRSFYKRFYHPSQMAVVAVGDFDCADVERQIKLLFDIVSTEICPLAREPTAPERPFYEVPDSKGVTVASSTDPELSFAQGIIDCKRPRRLAETVADYRRSLTVDLFHKAFGSRLLKLTVEPKGTRNFFMVSTESGEPVPTLNPMTIQIAPLPGRMRPALQEIMSEIERVKQFGFHDSEIARAKRSFLADFEMDYIERNQRSSESIADEYASLFLDKDPAPGSAKQSQIAATVIPSISCSEVTRVADMFDFTSNVVVKLATPPLSWRTPLYSAWSIFQALRSFRLPRSSLDLPSDADIEAIVRTVQRQQMEPWPADEDDPSTRLKIAFDKAIAKNASQAPALVEGPATPHRALRSVESSGVPEAVRGAELDVLKPTTAKTGPVGEEVILRNGLRLFLKHTDLFDDEIVLRGRRWGGLTEHQSDGMMDRGAIGTEAQISSMAAMLLGICGMSVESLQESLDGLRVEPNAPALETYHTALEASSSPMDFETLLLLLHLLFVNPVEPESQSRGRLSLVKFGLLAWRLGEDRDPGSIFRQRVLKCITSNHPYTKKLTLWSILRLNFKKASAIFNERASRPSEWTMVIVGKLPARGELLALLDKYLGSIPNFDRTSDPRDMSRISCDSDRKSDFELREAVTPLDICFPKGTTREDVRLKMIDPKGSTVIYFPIELEPVTERGSLPSAEAELRDLFLLRILVRMLETRFIEVLRFKRGQVYGVSVGDDFSLATPRMGCKRKATISISFECDPAEADELLAVTLEELDDLRSGKSGFTQENLDSAREQDRRQIEESFLKNDWWAGTVCELYFSRCHVVTEDIGQTIAVWWRVRCQALSSWNVDSATRFLTSLIPVGASSATLTMRPKKRFWGGSQSSAKLENKAGKED